MLNKLVYIANARLPTEKAHGIQIMKMCEAFASFSEVELIAPRRWNWLKEDPFRYYGVNRNFKIKKLPCLDLIPLDKYIGQVGFWIESFSFFVSVLFCLLLRATFTNRTPDIIYIRDRSLLPLRLFNKKVVFEAHVFFKNYFLYFPFLKRINKMVVITQKLEGLFVEKGISENKFLVAPDGVDLDEFDIKDDREKYRGELGLPVDKIIIGYVGRLETIKKEKGIDILIRALIDLRAKFKNILLCLVGGPSERIKEYQNLIKEMEAEQKHIIFTDQVSKNLIPKYLKSFNVLVLPFPRTEHYAFYASPLKLFEYMASKRPIVASDLPSIGEILKHEKNAILVEADNPLALAEGIERVLMNKEKAERISKQAFKDVQKYSWTKRVEKIIAFMKENQ